MHARLNPYAKEFVPSGHTTRPVPSPKTNMNVSHEDCEVETTADIPQLPTEVIARIASFLYHPQDLCGFLLGGKQLLAAAQDARVRLKLTNHQKNQLSSPQHVKCLKGLVTSIVKYFPAATYVDLSGLPLETPHVKLLLKGLPHLETLSLSSCKKLTPPLLASLGGRPPFQPCTPTTTRTSSSSSSTTRRPTNDPNQAETSQELQTSLQPFAAGPAKHHKKHATTSSSNSNSKGEGKVTSVHTHHPHQQQHGQQQQQLHRLDLQRCFQLDSTCLTEVLLLSAQPSGHQLELLALSHLDLRFWPEPYQHDPEVLQQLQQEQQQEERKQQLEQHHRGKGQQQQQEEGQQEGPLPGGSAAKAAQEAVVLPRAAAAGGDRESSRRPEQWSSSGLPRPSGMTSRSRWLGFCGLRMLVLNNCTMLSPGGLVSLVSCCPHLEFLFLGGCQLAPVAQQLEREMGGLPQGPVAAGAVTGGGGAVRWAGSGESPSRSWGSSVASGSSLEGGAAAAARMGALISSLSSSRESVSGVGGVGSARDVPVVGAGLGVGVLEKGLAADGEVLRWLWKQMQRLQLELNIPEELPACYIEDAAAGSSTSSAGNTSSTSSTAAIPVPAAAAGRRRVRRAPRVLRLDDPTQVLRQSMVLSPEAAKEYRCQGLLLAVVLEQLPRLVACEVTFFPSHVVGWLRCVRDQQQLLKLRLQEPQQEVGPAGAVGGGRYVEGCCGGGLAGVWNMCSTESLLEVTRCLEQAERKEGYINSSSSSSYSSVRRVSITSTRNPTSIQVGSTSSLPMQVEGSMLSRAADKLNEVNFTVSAESLAMGLKCSVNCSSKGRSTPLHAAADAGDAARCQLLIDAGASTTARDSSGASPLFLACEAGREGAAEVLLGAGADPLASNTAGETPLYIAALRGHMGVVRLLLGRLRALGVSWQDRSLYGDAWTPLMAAAVAGRTDVAGCLLQAAGRAAPELLAAANRYGQTVLHIAARKGSMDLLQLLLAYGDGLGVRVADACGDTPLDIARRFRHEGAVAEFVKVSVRG